VHHCHDSSISLLSLHEEGTNQRQTTDDPQIPAPAPVRSDPAVLPPPPSAQIQTSTIQAAPRERSNYRLRHTFRGHTQSVSAGNFNPDRSLLAPCGVSALCVCLGSLYAWSCSRLVICFATYHQSMVAFHRRTKPQPQWAYEGSLGHLVVERWDIPCFRIGRYEYTNMERRNGSTTKHLRGHTSFVFCVNYNTASTLSVSGG